jgi:signal transduction histidine kinase
MESISAFFDRNIVVVFFFYGLAFFSMGLAIWLEVGRSSEDRSAKALLFLAAFGLLHGSHEWFEVFTILKWADVTDPSSLLLLELLRVVLLAISFILLFIFGLRSIFANRQSGENGRRATAMWTIGLAVLWLFAIILVFVARQPCGIDCLAASDVLSRYLLAIPASLLAAWAMITQRKAYKVKGMPNCARDITWAALALLLYGVVGQSFTRETFLFPSSIINSDLFRQFFGVPVQLFRGVMAAMVAIFVIRAMRSFELDRRQSLEAAIEERLAAQRKSVEIQQQARAETEQLNRELQEAVQDLTMLFELSRSLAATLDRDVMLKQAMAKIYESVPRIHGGMIMLREGEDRPLQQMATIGYGPSETQSLTVEVTDRQAISVAEAVVSSGQSFCWTGAKLIPAIQCSCTTGVPDPEQSSSPSGDRTMGMPLVIRDLVAGSLVLSIDAGTTWLTPRDLSLIRTIAGQLNLAVANAMLYKEVRTRDALRGELLHQIVSAQEQERQGIARDLHDGVGQMATAMGLGLAAASESVRTDPELAERQLVELKTMSGQLVQELQGLIAGLRPSVLDDLGLVPALDGLVKEFEDRTRVETEFKQTGNSRRILPDFETIVFRIAQEGLSNVAKHTQATLVQVHLDFMESSVGLRIQDNGCGFNPQEILHSDPKHQWGLIGIRERVALVGGACDIVSWPGDGTIIQVSIPLNEEAPDV